MSTLLPCPFCGGRAALACDGAEICCCACGAGSGRYAFPEGAVSAWNHRTRGVLDDPNAAAVSCGRLLADICGVNNIPCGAQDCPAPPASTPTHEVCDHGRPVDGKGG